MFGRLPLLHRIMVLGTILFVGVWSGAWLTHAMSPSVAAGLGAGLGAAAGLVVGLVVVHEPEPQRVRVRRY